MQEIKAKEAKESSATTAAEKKAKAAQDAHLKKQELARKKEEQKAEKQDAQAQAKAAREKEKLRRQRRGPGVAMMEGHAGTLLAAADMCAPTVHACEASLRYGGGHVVMYVCASASCRPE